MVNSVSSHSLVRNCLELGKSEIIRSVAKNPFRTLRQFVHSIHFPTVFVLMYLVPRETCTVNELLDQIGVPYERDTDIQCYAKPGMNIDFLVTVGVNINEIPRDIVSAAENTMNMKEQQQRQPIQQNQVTVTPNTIRTVQKSMVVQVPKVQAAVHTLNNAVM